MMSPTVIFRLPCRTGIGRLRELVAQFGPGFRAQLRLVADHAIDLGHGGEAGPESICAAHPVTMIRDCGRSRLSRRIDWRAWRSASAVTAQLLTTTTSARPAAVAWRRMISDS